MVENKKVSLIAGGAGFIGVNLIDRLLGEGRIVVLVDNMSRGSIQLVKEFNKSYDTDKYVIVCDSSDRRSLSDAFRVASNFGELDEVWHLAANSDIPAGIADANVDLKDTFLTTFALLEQMKHFKVGTLNFASSSAIYGDFGGVSIHENIGPLLPISNYGAMKLASEALISAAVESYLKRANVFRFPNVVGTPATHGVILDFINKLIDTPKRLNVLGDGSQQKAYLHVSDLIQAMLLVRARKISSRIDLINIGPLDGGVTVKWIAEQVAKRVSSGAEIVYGSGNKGWVGDVPKFNYLTNKLQSYGWAPKLNSAGAVLLAIDEIALQLGR